MNAMAANTAVPASARDSMKAGIASTSRTAAPSRRCFAGGSISTSTG